MIFPFGIYKDHDLAEIPDTYLDWIVGESWFISQPRNKTLIEAIGKELETRKRSRYHIEDQYGKTMEDV